MDNWIIVDRIKRGMFQYSIGDEVILFRRKGKYPRDIDESATYTITDIQGDFLIVNIRALNGMGWMSPVKVHKTYMVPKYGIRDIKIDLLFR